MKIPIILFSLTTFAVAEVRVNIDSLVIREDLDSKGRMYLPKTNKPFQGMVYSVYPSGQLEFEGLLESGLQHGIWVWWYPSGEEKSEITFWIRFYLLKS